MHSFSDVSKKISNPPVNQIAMLNDSYYPDGLDASLPLDLNDLDREKRIECRSHKRFQLDKDAFAMIRSISTGPLEIIGKSMGCIACAVFNAKPVKLGKIDNISIGGLMFHHVDSEAQLSRALVLDILMADCGFYLANMPFKIITDVVIPDEISSNAFELRQVRLQFQKLNTLQRARLEKFIVNHSTKIGEAGTED